MQLRVSGVRGNGIGGAARVRAQDRRTRSGGLSLDGALSQQGGCPVMAVRPGGGQQSEDELILAPAQQFGNEIRHCGYVPEAFEGFVGIERKAGIRLIEEMVFPDA